MLAIASCHSVGEAVYTESLFKVGVARYCIASYDSVGAAVYTESLFKVGNASYSLL